jgi:hypothetical protein
MKLPPAQRQAIGSAQLDKLCQLGFEDEQLASMDIDGSCGDSGGAFGATQASCNCDCNSWLQLGNIPGCASECDSKWKTWQCGPYLQTGLGTLDAETLRYQSRLQELGLAANEVMPMVYIFELSSPDLRAGQWEDLDNHQDLQSEQDLTVATARIQAEKEAAAQSNYDSETRRYQAALEQAGYPDVEVKGLVANFSSSPDVIRAVYWNDITER